MPRIYTAPVITHQRSNVPVVEPKANIENSSAPAPPPKPARVLKDAWAAFPTVASRPTVASGRPQPSLCELNEQDPAGPSLPPRPSSFAAAPKLPQRATLTSTLPTQPNVSPPILPPRPPLSTVSNNNPLPSVAYSSEAPAVPRRPAPNRPIVPPRPGSFLSTTRQIPDASRKESHVVPPRSRVQKSTLRRDPTGIYYDTMNFDNVDTYAKAAPLEYTSSVQQLTHYLVSPFADEVEKYRAIFVWIADNIEYDVERFFGGAKTSQAPNDVLSSRKGVCAGYASLFQQMCDAAGLRCTQVSGSGKGYGYVAGKTPVQRENHAWNAVFVHNQWRMVDVCWGAGVVNASQAFEKKFNPFYFLSDPREFVGNHLPKNTNEQYLDDPISDEEYSRAVAPQPGFYMWGLEAEERDCVLDVTPRAGEDYKVRILVPEDVYFSCNIMSAGGPLENAANPTIVGILNGQREVSVLIRCPGEGDYSLRFWAGISGTTFPLAIEYQLRCSGETGLVSQPFPKVYSKTLSERLLAVQAPLNGDLPLGSRQAFRIQSFSGRPETLALISPARRFYYLNAVSNMYKLDITLGETGEWSLGVKQSQGDSFSYAAVWKVAPDR
ncbi:hypothetical protein BC832DRAFT_284069 [Gaertneriomyces semiglobifer]|nr:hypothetical protein BC832DRAFT_284069 [Gaertneriomyces semiglobifer]